MTLQAFFFIAVFIGATVSLPHAKDLLANVAAAQRAISYFDLEVNYLSSAVTSFESEFNFDVLSTAKNVLGLLQELEVSNYQKIEQIMFEKHEQANAHTNALNSNLRMTSAQLTSISSALADLSITPTDVTSLKSSVAAGDEIFNLLVAGLQRSVTEIEEAITTGIGFQENHYVARVWVAWTKIKDILVYQETTVRNVKLNYDIKAQETITALGAVVGPAAKILGK